MLTVPSLCHFWNFPTHRQLSQETMDRIYHDTGAPIHSAYALPQLLDIYDPNNPLCGKNMRGAIHKWQTIPGICLSRWTGEKFLPLSYSEASWTGLLNFRTCQYEPTIVGLLPAACQQALPSLADFSDSQGFPGLIRGIQQDKRDGKPNLYWDRWPELRGPSDGTTGCRLFLGLGDGACANIGSKCSTVSRIAVTIGTSAAARVCLPLPVGSSGTNNDTNVPKGLFCYRINSEHILLGGALTDGGSVVEWISSLLNLRSGDAFDECMARVKTLVEEDYRSSASTDNSSSQSLTVVPFLSGERSTGYRDNVTGAILGLTLETTSAHLMKACLEGVTLRLNAVLGLVRNATSASREREGDHPCVIASGKALEVNGLWRQLISDCSGMDVIMDGGTEEGTSRGVAIAIAVALNATRKGHSFADEPLSRTVQVYTNAFRHGILDTC
jgi:gluconokinase